MPAEEKKKDAEAKWRRVNFSFPAGQGAKRLARTGPKEPLMGLHTSCKACQGGGWWPGWSLQER